MSLTKKLAANTLAQIIGKFALAILGLVEFSLITRYLGQTGYGLFTTVYGFLMVVGIFVDLGLQMTTTVLLAKPEADENKILSNALTIRLVASVLFLGLAPAISLLLPYPGVVQAGIAIAAIGFVFASLNSTITSLFQKHLITHQLALAECIAKAAYVLAIFYAITRGVSLLGLIGITSTNTVLLFIILWVLARRRVRVRLAFDRGVWQTILHTTWPVAATIALNLIYFKGDIIIMSLYRTPAEVGLYGAPYKLLEVLINAAYLFLGLVLPLLSLAAGSRNLERVRYLTQTVFDALSVAIVPLIIGTWIVAEPILRLAAGNDFVGAASLLRILILATAIIFIAGLFGYSVMALNAQRKMIIYYAINAVASLIAYLALIPRFGAPAAAWITVVSELFILLTAGYVLFRETQFVPRLAYTSKALVAGGVMGITLWLLPTLPVLITIAAGMVLYALTLYLIRGIPHQLLALIRR